jgi:hypothetical protein
MHKSSSKLFLDVIFTFFGMLNMEKILSKNTVLEAKHNING